MLRTSTGLLMVPVTGFCQRTLRKRDALSNSNRMTVREMARLAGVSVATVSRVFNGTGQVSEEMRQRVLESIKAHGYQPDHRGRALAARRHNAVGLVFPGLAGPYFAELIQGFEQEAVQSRASVHILCTHLREDSDEQVIEMARRVDGLAVIGGTVSDDAVLAPRRPACRSSRWRAPAPGPCRRSGPRTRAAMHALTTHLLVDHGLTDLIFVGSPDGSPDVSERWDGFRAAHRDLGRAPCGAARSGSACARRTACTAADQLLRRRPVPQAIVCANDETALGVLVRRARRRRAGARRRRHHRIRRRADGRAGVARPDHRAAADPRTRGRDRAPVAARHARPGQQRRRRAACCPPSLWSAAVVAAPPQGPATPYPRPRTQSTNHTNARSATASDGGDVHTPIHLGARPAGRHLHRR